MDVHVHRAGMLRIARQHLLGERDDVLGARVWSAIALPVAPRPQVHHRLDIEHRGVEIIREPLVHTAHRVRVRRVARLPIRRRSEYRSRQRVDVRLLARRGAPLHRHRLLHQLVRLRLLVGLHQRVDVRTEHERLTPVGHREIGIEPRRLSKRPPRLGMIERVGEVETLIHERLRLAVARRHRERVRTEVLQTRRQRAGRRRLRRLCVGGFGSSARARRRRVPCAATELARTHTP